jgi:hypothetical protein
VGWSRVQAGTFCHQNESHEVRSTGTKGRRRVETREDVPHPLNMKSGPSSRSDLVMSAVTDDEPAPEAFMTEKSRVQKHKRESVGLAAKIQKGEDKD